MPTSIRLSPEIDARLSALAAKTARSKSFYLREIIERGLEDVEDYYLAVEISERIKRGEEKVVSSEEAWRGLDD